MIKHRDILWKNRVSISLFRSVFAIYCIVAIVVTIGSLIAEYKKTEQMIERQLFQIKSAFERPLSNALWEFDRDYIQIMLESINNNLIIAGVVLEDEQDRMLGRFGHVPESVKKQKLFKGVGATTAFVDQATVGSESLQSFQFALVAPSAYTSRKLGTLKLFWDRETIYDEVYYEFAVLIIGAIVKTIFLWVIFLIFARALLNRPMMALTEAIHAMDEKNLAQSMIKIPTQRYNEFSLIQDCFNQMLKRLIEAQKDLISKVGLIQEINHRVKNNLQVVSSLLSLQFRPMRDPAIQQALITIQSRVQTISLVHELMNYSKGIGPINSRHLFEHLAQSLNQFHALSQKGIELFIRGEPLNLSSKQATHIGLIVQEGIYNAIRHAFIGRSCGQIICHLSKQDEKTLHLVISDNGIGYTEPESQNKKGLGLILMRALAVQYLGGTMHCNGNRDGSQLTFTFPKVC
ncbi:histidine kinase dimerization/phosphoacceptor domain -containing protein [Magnetococcales bacterium HHB-1]